MSTLPDLVLEDLLQPLPGDAPTGSDLSFSEAFDQIALARREDDPSLDQGEWVTPLKSADWPEVARRCSALLAQQTKDIRLAGWLTEALAKTRHFAGLAQGFELITALCQRYWDSLHPLPDAGDYGQRSGNLAWLVQRSATLLRELPVTAAPSQLSSNDYLSAQALKAAMERDPDQADALAQGRVTLAEFERAVRSSGRDYYRQRLLDVQALQTAFAALSETLDGLLAGEAPSYRALRTALEEVSSLVERNARQLGVGEVLTPEPAIATTTPAANSEAAGPMASRAQALQQLRIVADYFRRTEPHSPVAYLAEKAAQWGEMPLHAWLRAVVKDGGTLAQLEEVLGLERTRADEQSGE